MAVSQSSFRTIAKTFKLDHSKKVSHMQVIVAANDCGEDPDASEHSAKPSVHFTDIMLQGGTVATSWVGHVSEIRWSFDNA